MATNKNWTNRLATETERQLLRENAENERLREELTKAERGLLDFKSKNDADEEKYQKARKVIKFEPADMNGPEPEHPV